MGFSLTKTIPLLGIPFFYGPGALALPCLGSSIVPVTPTRSFRWGIPSIFLSISIFAHVIGSKLRTYLSICLSIYLSVCLSIVTSFDPQYNCNFRLYKMNDFQRYGMACKDFLSKTHRPQPGPLHIYLLTVNSLVKGEDGSISSHVDTHIFRTHLKRKCFSVVSKMYLDAFQQHFPGKKTTPLSPGHWFIWCSCGNLWEIHLFFTYLQL